MAQASRETRLSIVYQIFRALREMEYQGVIHGALQPRAILLHPNPKGDRFPLTQITNFGQYPALFRSANQPWQRHQQRQPQLVQAHSTYVRLRVPLVFDYVAPEMCRPTSPFGHEIDMWAAGLIACEIMMGQPLFSSLTNLRDFASQLHTFFDPDTGMKLDSFCFRYHLDAKRLQTDPFYDLLCRCLHPDPAQRLSAEQATRHPLFREIRVHLAALHPIVSDGSAVAVGAPHPRYAVVLSTLFRDCLRDVVDFYARPGPGSSLFDQLFLKHPIPVEVLSAATWNLARLLGQVRKGEEVFWLRTSQLRGEWHLVPLCLVHMCSLQLDRENKNLEQQQQQLSVLRLMLNHKLHQGEGSVAIPTGFYETGYRILAMLEGLVDPFSPAHYTYRRLYRPEAKWDPLLEECCQCLLLALALNSELGLYSYMTAEELGETVYEVALDVVCRPPAVAAAAAAASDLKGQMVQLARTWFTDSELPACRPSDQLRSTFGLVTFPKQ